MDGTVKCIFCGKEIEGGCRSSFGAYCFECEEKKENKIIIERHNNEEMIKTIKEYNKKGLCGYRIANGEFCQNKIPCKKHQDLTCWVCGKKAISNCINYDDSLSVCEDHPQIMQTINYR